MKTATIAASRTEVFEAAKTACKRLGLSIESSDSQKGRIRAFHSGNLLSFGNEITVNISTKERKSTIRISSKSAAAIQVIDWGTNKDLELNLRDEIKAILSR